MQSGTVVVNIILWTVVWTFLGKWGGFIRPDGLCNSRLESVLLAGKIRRFSINHSHAKQLELLFLLHVLVYVVRNRHMERAEQHFSGHYACGSISSWHRILNLVQNTKFMQLRCRLAARAAARLSNIVRICVCTRINHIVGDFKNSHLGQKAVPHYVSGKVRLDICCRVKTCVST